MQTNKKHRFLAIVIVACLISLGVALILNNFRENIIFYFSPSELIAKKISTTQIIRIGGIVKKDSIVKKHLNITFVLTDFVEDVIVKYNGFTPSLFKEGQGSVVKGTFDGKVFSASEILAKHDENYMPKEVIDSIKSTGQWRE